MDGVAAIGANEEVFWFFELETFLADDAVGAVEIVLLALVFDYVRKGWREMADVSRL